MLLTVDFAGLSDLRSCTEMARAKSRLVAFIVRTRALDELFHSATKRVQSRKTSPGKEAEISDI